MADPSYVYAGAVMRYQANIKNLAPNYSGAFEGGVTAAIRSRANLIGGSISGFLLSGGPDYNLQCNFTSGIDRGSIQDIVGDFGSALTSVPNLRILAQAGQFISNPRKDGQKQPGAIPGPIQGDNYHSGDTTAGNFAQFWFGQAGEQVQGVVKALSQGSPMMWLGIGAVVLILLTRK